MPQAPQALEIQDVSKRFGLHWALLHLTFTLPLGQSLLLTGHNGSGKTTLLRLLASAVKPTAGLIQVLGRDSSQTEEVRRDVALLSHRNFLYDDLTAEQNLTLVARLMGLDDSHARAKRLLEEFGLGARSKQAVRGFSAGMKKRLGLARVLLQEPKVALLDEPFGELDPNGMAQVETLILELQKRAVTVVLATHHVEQGLRLCQARLHLSEGRGSPS